MVIGTSIIGTSMMNEYIEEMIEEEVMKKVEELRKAMAAGDYKRTNKILEMFLYCISESDNTDVMIA